MGIVRTADYNCIPSQGQGILQPEVNYVEVMTSQQRLLGVSEDTAVLRNYKECRVGCGANRGSWAKGNVLRGKTDYGNPKGARFMLRKAESQKTPRILVGLQTQSFSRTTADSELKSVTQ